MKSVLFETMDFAIKAVLFIISFFLQMTLTHPSKKIFCVRGMLVMGTVHATSTFFPILLQRSILSPTQASRFTPFTRTFLLQISVVFLRE